MGGKTKQAQRVKNNAKPSSSSRSAELLGVSVPSFVGFSAHSDLGLVPFAPGFSNADQLSDTFDGNISPQFQLALRKMSKKDPLTRKKALQEFMDLINESDLDTIKTILPIWPKYYHNLATDTEHLVRELAQTVQQLLAAKCKRSLAPYLKQIIPMWLASQFDNYAPVASIASNAFRETFAGGVNRTQEVCLHCQTEILEFATRNLTFHTAATLSQGKNLPPEDAEQKYQRVIVCSLKTLSFFAQHTSSAPDLSQAYVSFQKLLEHPKFWSFSKHKLPAIKAAWFELFYNIMQNSSLIEVINDSKSQLITICFQNIDDADPLVAPHIWGCTLLLQEKYDNWHDIVNFKKVVAPKLSAIVRNALSKNAKAICPNLLPFFSKLLEDSLEAVDIHEYSKQFLDDMKSIICTINPPSKADYAIIVKTYFECLRFLLQRLNKDFKNSEEEEKFALRLLDENVIELITWFLLNEKAISKCFFQQTSMLVSYWAERECNGSLHARLLAAFWSRNSQLVTESIKQQNVEYVYVERYVGFVQQLCLHNSSNEEQKVKFAETTATDVSGVKKPCAVSKNSKTVDVSFVQNELKELVLQLAKFCVSSIKQKLHPKYILSLRSLTKMYTDSVFYCSIAEGNSLTNTLDLLKSLVDALEGSELEVLVDIMFDILQELDKSERFSYIDDQLLKLPHYKTQEWILHRLLSYPICIEPKLHDTLAMPAAKELICKITHDAVTENSKDKFNLLHKCFFQNDAGEILITQATVDEILKTLLEPLDSTGESTEIVDVCGSFVAQIMPVVCSGNNSSKEMRHMVFLKLFQFTLERTTSDYLSEDTIWEVTTCWQDSLSSFDISLGAEMLHACANIVEQRLHAKDITLASIDTIAEAIAKLITCATEKICRDEDRQDRVFALLQQFLVSDAIAMPIVKNFQEFCLMLESLNGFASLGIEVENACTKCPNFLPIFSRTVVNFTLIIKLVCNFGKMIKPPINNDDDTTEDCSESKEFSLTYWPDKLLGEIQTYIDIATSGESLLPNAGLDQVTEELIFALSVRVKVLMEDGGEIVGILRERLLKTAALETSITACRSLKFLINFDRYTECAEKATRLLAEEIAVYFLTQNCLKAYIYSIQTLLPDMREKEKSIPIPSSIIEYKPQEMWLQAAIFRCILENNYQGPVTEIPEDDVVMSVVQFITSISEQQHAQKDLLLYNMEIHKQPFAQVINTVEYINLLARTLDHIAYDLTIKNWDAIRLGIGSWVLSVSKSIESYSNPKCALFIVSVFNLFTSLSCFIQHEKEKSSTQFLKDIIDEWENVFAREVNVVLFKAFYTLCNLQGDSPVSLAADSPGDNRFLIFMLELLLPAIDVIDYTPVYAFYKNSTKIPMDDILKFLLANLANPLHNLRATCVRILRKLTPFFVADDIQTLERKSDTLEAEEASRWHYLNRFEDCLKRYELTIQKYLNEFSFKLTEIPDFGTIDYTEGFSYLLLWDCIIYACRNSPAHLRSVYTTWLQDNKYEESLLHFLFRAMPIEILKNYDSKIMSNDVFKRADETIQLDVMEKNLSLEKFACFMYTEVLRKLPAVVRKWWNRSQSRQKTFVDKLTSNFVSQLICNEELKAISNKREKHENMQVTVHTSTREVLAVYSIDEARMELVITLAQNYPLGGVKVECGKQIGGRATSRNVGMQLTIFLTHQNGTIFDGLSLWKNNLDKKFEGVEECYVCYTVIHQDTCQLPKLTCKTCKKKFHGPCLYKWFTTSSKSTCPICRNVF